LQSIDYKKSFTALVINRKVNIERENEKNVRYFMSDGTSNVK